jgi:hypothetical protein
VDLEAGLFTISYLEYLTLPAVLLDLLRIVRDVKAEIKANAIEQGN